jgi:hypothetical protein
MFLRNYFQIPILIRPSPSSSIPFFIWKLRQWKRFLLGIGGISQGLHEGDNIVYFIF